MNCQICGKELNGKQSKYCSEDCVRDGKKKLNSSVNSYKDYTHMLPVELMLKINRDLITLKKDKEKVLSEYEKNKYFKYIKIHVERVTKGV